MLLNYWGTSFVVFVLYVSNNCIYIIYIIIVIYRCIIIYYKGRIKSILVYESFLLVNMIIYFLMIWKFILNILIEII